MVAELFLNDFKDYSVAADLYAEIIYSYPGDIIEVKIFIHSHVYANHLDYLVMLSIFMKNSVNYPSDDLISSIDYELNNLSKINLN